MLQRATPAQGPNASDILRGRREFHRLPAVLGRKVLQRTARRSSELLCDTVLSQVLYLVAYSGLSPAGAQA